MARRRSSSALPAWLRHRNLLTTEAVLVVAVGMELLQRRISGAVSVPWWGKTLLVMAVNAGVLGGLSLYGIGTVLWLGVLSRTEVSQAYPFVGLGFVLTALIGYVLFGDSIGPLRIAGIALVIAGIALIARS